jgi:hypothetical protein
LFFYRIDKDLEIRITDELGERRKSYELAAPPFTPDPEPVHAAAN